MHPPQRVHSHRLLPCRANYICGFIRNRSRYKGQRHQCIRSCSSTHPSRSPGFNKIFSREYDIISKQRLWNRKPTSMLTVLKRAIAGHNYCLLNAKGKRAKLIIWNLNILIQWDKLSNHWPHADKVYMACWSQSVNSISGYVYAVFASMGSAYCSCSRTCLLYFAQTLAGPCSEKCHPDLNQFFFIVMKSGFSPPPCSNC